MISTNYEQLYIRGEKNGSETIYLSSSYPISVSLTEYSKNLNGNVEVTINNNNTKSPSISVSYSDLYLKGETYSAVLEVRDREDYISIPIVVNCSDTLIYVDVDRTNGMDITFTSLPEIKSLNVVKGNEEETAFSKIQIVEDKVRKATFNEVELFGVDYVIATNGLSQIAVDRDGQAIGTNKGDEAELYVYFPGGEYSEIIRADTDVSYIDIDLQGKNMINECVLYRHPLGFYQYLYKLPGYINKTLNVRLRLKPSSYRYAFSGSNLTAILMLPLPSKVTDITGCFQCPRLTDISGLRSWDTSNVTKMAAVMNAFSIEDISPLYNWNLSNVTDISGFFASASKLTDLSPVRKWDTRNVINASSIFSDNTSLVDATPIGGWDLSKAEDVGGLFFGCSNLKTVPYLNIPSATRVANIFYGCSNLTDVGGLGGLKESLDLSESPLLTHQSLMNIITNLDTVYTFPSLKLSFESLSALSNEEIMVAINKGWNVEGFVNADVPQIEEFRYNFTAGKDNLLYDNSYSVDRDFDVFINGRLYPDGNTYKAYATGYYNVIYDFSESEYPLKSLFKNCVSLQSMGNINRDIDGESLSEMFYGCYNLVYLTDLATWNVRNVTDLSYMFYKCSRIIDASFISGWDLSKIQNISYMFNGDSSLQIIPELDGTNIVEDGMTASFVGCSNLTTFGGIKNCKYSLDLSSSGGLTHASLMNVINNLAYVDRPQTLKLHSRSLDKLTDEEIMIAIDKGWEVYGYIRKMDSVTYKLRIDDVFKENVIASYVGGAQFYVTHVFGDEHGVNININDCIYIREHTLYYKVPQRYEKPADDENWYTSTEIDVSLVFSDSADEPIKGIFSGMDTVHSYIEGLTYRYTPHDISCTQIIPWSLERTLENTNANLDIPINSNRMRVNNLSYAFACTDGYRRDRYGDLIEIMDTKEVANMEGVFLGTNFGNSSTQTPVSLANWNTSNVTNMSHMFEKSKYYGDTFVYLSDWNTSNVTNMGHMFDSLVPGDPISLIPISGWDTRSVTDMSYMFCDTYITNIDFLSNWNTSNVTNMSYMFKQNNDLNQEHRTSVPTLDTSSVTNISGMLCENSYITSVPEFDTHNVVDMSYFLYGCRSLTSIPEFDTHNVVDMSYAFGGTYKLTSVPEFDTSSVTNMQGLFYGSGLVNAPTLNTQNVTDMSYMFYDNGDLVSIPEFDTGKVNAADDMLYMCSQLTDVGGFNDLKCSLRLSSNYNLTSKSISNIIYKLGNVDSATLILHTNQFKMLTGDLISIAIGKGWTLEEYDPGNMSFTIIGKSFESSIYDPNNSVFSKMKYCTDVVYKGTYGINKVNVTSNVETTVNQAYSQHYTIYSPSSLLDVPLNIKITKDSYYYDYSWTFYDSDIKKFNTNLSIPRRGAGTYNLTSMFESCQYLEIAPKLTFADKSNCTNLFRFCDSIHTVPFMEFGLVTDATEMFIGCSKLVDLGGFKDIKVSLSLISSPLLTHESLMNVINNLATATNSPTLTLHADSLAQLSDAEIAIAINKGWVVR